MEVGQNPFPLGCSGLEGPDIAFFPIGRQDTRIAGPDRRAARPQPVISPGGIDKHRINGIPRIGILTGNFSRPCKSVVVNVVVAHKSHLTGSINTYRASSCQSLTCICVCVVVENVVPDLDACGIIRNRDSRQISFRDHIVLHGEIVAAPPEDHGIGPHPTEDIVADCYAVDRVGTGILLVEIRRHDGLVQILAIIPLNQDIRGELGRGNIRENLEGVKMRKGLCRVALVREEVVDVIISQDMALPERPDCVHVPPDPCPRGRVEIHSAR